MGYGAPPVGLRGRPAGRMRTFVGFGFGAIQGGLFLYEAARSGHFDRLVVAEIQEDVVAAVRAGGGRYTVNIARPEGLEAQTVDGVEILNPRCAGDRKQLLAALAEAEEMATALPSVDFYSRDEYSAAALLSASFPRRAKPGVVYTGENHNHAAERLAAAAGQPDSVQYLNTVIGKMSGVVRGDAIRDQGLSPIVPGLDRAFLVEAFNRILISRITRSGLVRGITVFEEKEDLLPFEEAKLYGHNATHALLGLLAHRRGHRYMSDLTGDPEVLETGRQAFQQESGAALCRRHAGVDPLFTPAGYQAYVEDLLQRMTNPHLRDQVARVIRDPRRKLGWEDRLIGTMRLALQAGIRPWRYAQGARIALDLLEGECPDQPRATLLDSCWPETGRDPALAVQLKELLDHGD